MFALFFDVHLRDAVFGINDSKDESPLLVGNLVLDDRQRENVAFQAEFWVAVINNQTPLFSPYFRDQKTRRRYEVRVFDRKSSALSPVALQDFCR